MGIDPSGLICISPNVKNAVSGASGSAASAAVITKHVGCWRNVGLGSYGWVFSRSCGKRGYCRCCCVRSCHSYTKGRPHRSCYGRTCGSRISSSCRRRDGAIEGTSNAPRAISPTGWKAVAAPALTGVRSGLVGWAASAASEWAVEKFNDQFGDCGCE